MWTRPALAGVTASALLAAGLALAPTAAALPADPQVVQVVTQVECGEVAITLTNPDVGAYGFVYTTGPFDGGLPGESGRIDVAAGASVTRVVKLPEDSFAGRGFLTLGVAYGPNTHRQPFVDLGLVDTDCAAPTTPPTTQPTTSPAPTTDAPPTTTGAPTTSGTPAPTLNPAPTTSDSGDDGDYDQVGTPPRGSIATGG